MLGKYIELHHNLKQRKVKNHKKVLISTILHEIGERKTEAAVESAIGSVQLVMGGLNLFALYALNNLSTLPARNVGEALSKYNFFNCLSILLSWEMIV